jgi:putative aldouronate transport system permease protein
MQMTEKIPARWQGISGRTFDIINYIFLALISLCAVIPFIYILTASVTPPDILAGEPFILIPKGFTLESYRYIFSTRTVPNALKVSLFITVFGTLFRLCMTILFAYPLSHKNIKGRSVILFLVTFTMMFSGGIIPSYMVVRGLGLIDSYWALFLPGAINTFNFVIFRNFFQSIPEELEESAKIDGAGYLRILWTIILPVSLPMIATFTIMYSVDIWNAWFNATMYINDTAKWPIQVILRQIVNMSMNVGASAGMGSEVIIPQANVRMCTIAVSTLPILMVYPFFQRYFLKGLLLGSVKG